MKRFTKLFMTLALLCMAGSVSAADIEVELTADMFKQWSTTDGTAVASDVDVTQDPNWAFNVGNEIDNGAVLCGTSTVYGFIFADLSEYTKIVFTGTPAEGKTEFNLRVLYNREGASGSNGEKGVKITTENPTAELNIADLKLSYFHLVAIKAGWGNTGTITSITLVKPDDPLAIPKENLRNSINSAKALNSFAKTESSWNTLQDAIAAGETALAAEDATQESLTNAKTDLENAISGLELMEGFSKLTAAAFKHYASLDEPGDGSSTGCAFNLGNASDLPFGDSNVGELNWADLSEYGKLIVVTSGDIKPRFCLNRLVANGQQAATQEESNMLDINPNNDFTWSTEKYLTVDGNVYTVDLAKIVADYGFARLHCIKKQGWGAGVFVTDLLLEELTEATTVPVTIGEAGYATFCSEKAVALETGMEAYAVEYNGSSAQLIPVEGAVDANTPVILKADADDYELEIVESAASPDKNDLKVSDGNVAGNGSIYVLANGSHDVGFYLLAEGVKIPAGKAYLEVNAGGREFIGFGDATGIKSVETVKANGTVYNLAGQQVKSAQKGVFIVNGKKVIK